MKVLNMTTNYDLGKQNLYYINQIRDSLFKVYVIVMNKRVHFSNIIFVLACRVCLNKRL